MGTKLADIVEAQTLTLSDLSGKELAVDAFNTIYSFLATIRQPDGTPLTDRQGRVTSHLSGMFYRNINLLENGINPVYVYDGKAPQLKSAEVQRRRNIRDAAYEEWEKAKEEGRIEDARKAGQASSRLTGPMIDESKELLQSLGIPVIQAPSEGEALAAQMAREGLVWASASQDNDSLLYNCPRMIRNLSISGRRRVSRSKKYKSIDPELILLDQNLELLGITREQLIDIAILVGTDYNDSVKGIGPKTALKLIKTHGNLEAIEDDRGEKFDFPYDEIRDIFLNPPKVKLERPKWSAPQPEEIQRILCKEHDFSENRVQKSLERLENMLEEIRGSTHQSSLSDFF
ncbi:flap endonuclease-1 [Candidatus Thorarchaeota archaeon]|nr:MAG: flap endonuclease-1 [Candidatus Thorarchaeota archaeon]